MAELLVRVVNKVNTDSIYLDVQCTKRGDVIVARPDGWTWGLEELARPAWRVLKIPALALAAAEALCAPELPVDPNHPSSTLQKRGVKLNVDAFQPDILAAVADAARANPILLIADPAATPAQLAANDPTLSLVGGVPNVTVATGRDASDRPTFKKIPIPVFRATLATLQALIVTKPPIPDPAVIGAVKSVIG